MQWHFTEITIGLDEEGGNFMTEEEQETQAVLYGGLMEACIDLGPEKCPSFQTWGVADRYSVARFTPKSSKIYNLFCFCNLAKLNRYTGNWAGYNPYLFDYDLNPKLSYYAVVDALQGTEVVKKAEQN